MNNIEQLNIEAIRDAMELVSKYSLEECLEKCHQLCDVLNDDIEFEKLYRRGKCDACLKEIYRLAIAKYGARNLLSALYYLAGDVDLYLSNLEQYRKDLNELKDFLNGW